MILTKSSKFHIWLHWLGNNCFMSDKCKVTFITLFCFYKKITNCLHCFIVLYRNTLFVGVKEKNIGNEKCQAKWHDPCSIYIWKNRQRLRIYIFNICKWRFPAIYKASVGKYRKSRRSLGLLHQQELERRNTGETRQGFATKGCRFQQATGEMARFPERLKQQAWAFCLPVWKSCHRQFPGRKDRHHNIRQNSDQQGRRSARHAT